MVVVEVAEMQNVAQQCESLSPQQHHLDSAVFLIAVIYECVFVGLFVCVCVRR